MNVTGRMSFGMTVAGGYNGSASTNQTLLSWPMDVLLLSNHTLYITNNDGRILAFDRNHRTGRTVATFNTMPYFLFIDNRTSNMYVTLRCLHMVIILPSNRTIPPDGLATSNCSLNRLYIPSLVAVDSIGNTYISSTSCHIVVKWAPNATSGTLIAGSSIGQPTSDSQGLIYPMGLILDGSGIGVTIAGGNGAGSGPNQLCYPIKIYLSKFDGSVFIADSHNNRIQKWGRNASSGITVAGSSAGLAGQTAYLIDYAYSLTIDDDETNLFVVDYQNQRVQHFPLY